MIWGFEKVCVCAQLFQNPISIQFVPHSIAAFALLLNCRSFAASKLKTQSVNFYGNDSRHQPRFNYQAGKQLV
jgi:hypothetical protein